ncbi:MAG TPA: hypothetical protein VFN42_06585 [Acetobacteraceae bacterium]|nr:hypothetical protein [Acetobacteraceae bacterium]
MHPTPSTAEPANRPEGDGGSVPEGIARLLQVLQWLVGCGRTFAETLHQRTAEEFRSFAGRYRRSDFNEILARMKRGLMLAAALEEKLLKRARTGHDVIPVEYRYSTPRSSSAPDTTGKRTRTRHTNIVDMPPDRLPTAEQIAAELRRRPLGAVLADICRDLGILPGDLTKQQWKELHELILTYGGDPTDVLFAEWHLRLLPLLEAELGKTAPAAPNTGTKCHDPACPTGPPDLAKAA